MIFFKNIFCTSEHFRRNNSNCIDHTTLKNDKFWDATYLVSKMGTYCEPQLSHFEQFLSERKLSTDGDLRLK